MATNFIVYLIGYSIAIIGVAFALSAAGIADEWIIAAALILIGLGIVVAMSRSQHDVQHKHSSGHHASHRGGFGSSGSSSSSEHQGRSSGSPESRHGG